MYFNSLIMIKVFTKYEVRLLSDSVTSILSSPVPQYSILTGVAIGCTYQAAEKNETKDFRAHYYLTLLVASYVEVNFPDFKT